MDLVTSRKYWHQRVKRRSLLCSNAVLFSWCGSSGLDLITKGTVAYLGRISCVGGSSLIHRPSVRLSVCREGAREGGREGAGWRRRTTRPRRLLVWRVRGGGAGGPIACGGVSLMSPVPLPVISDKTRPSARGRPPNLETERWRLDPGGDWEGGGLLSSLVGSHSGRHPSSLRSDGAPGQQWQGLSDGPVRGHMTGCDTCSPLLILQLA